MYKLTILGLLFFVSAVTEAKTSIIPNVYKNRRVIHDTAAAAGWSDRNSVGVDYQNNSSETKSNGVKTEEKDTDTFTIYSFNRTSFNLVTELQFENGSEEDKNINPVAADDDTDIDNLDFNIAYMFPSLPATIGLSVENEKEEETNGTSGALSQTRVRTYEIGLGYKLPNNVYLGFTYKEPETDTAANPNDEDDEFIVGAGYVSGDGKSPEYAAESYLSLINEEGTKINTLTVNGLTNLDEATEVSANLFYSQYDGIADGDFWGLTTSADFSLTNGIYFAPAIGFASYDVKNSWTGINNDTDGPIYYIEAGYRNAHIATYASYSFFEIDNEQVSSATVSTTNNTKANTVALGLNYQF